MFDRVPQALLLGGQVLDRASEFAQLYLRRGTLGLHRLPGLLERRQGDLSFSCNANLKLLEVADLLGELLRFGADAAEFGFRRVEISGSCIVGTLRYTGAGSKCGETQHPDCCGLNLFASPHNVILIVIAQKALPGNGTNGKCPASMIISIIFDANVQAKHRFLHESRASAQVLTARMGKDATRDTEVGQVRNC